MTEQEGTFRMSFPFLSLGSLTLKMAQENEMLPGLEAIKIVSKTFLGIILQKYKSRYWNFLINILLNLLQ